MTPEQKRKKAINDRLFIREYNRTRKSSPPQRLTEAMIEWIAKSVEKREERGPRNPAPALLTRQEAAELLNVSLTPEER